MASTTVAAVMPYTSSCGQLLMRQGDAFVVLEVRSQPDLFILDKLNRPVDVSLSSRPVEHQRSVRRS